MAVKKNDMVLNVLANPDFEARDLYAAGLSTDNTNLRTEDEYLASDKIKNNPAFHDASGNFDKGKFHEFYEKTAIMYNLLSLLGYNLAILDDALYSEENIWVEPSKRKISYAPKLVRVPNERLISSSLDGIGKKGARTRSTSEIALTLKIYDVETGKWKASPNDSFFSTLFTPLVLATYDEDEYDEDGKLAHKKGDLKYNEDYLPYYETLGGRNPSQKLVLNKLNTLTKDGSFANLFDFFDTDDIEQKSIGGTILRNAALVGSMFIPYVGPAVIATSVLTQAAGIGAVLGKIIAGSDSPTLNNLQGWAKSVSRLSSTEYASKNTWCVENFLNMIGDTTGLLAEQRWIFKAAPALMLWSTKPYKAMSSKGREAMIKEVEAKLNKEGAAAANKKIQQLMVEGGPAPRINMKAQLEQLLELNRGIATAQVDDLIKQSSKMGSPLAKAYMTAITVLDTYDEAKNAGASDMEAALLTVGYAGAELALLNTELGEWVMPELHGDRFKREAIVKALSDDLFVKEAKQTAATSKVGWAKKWINKGKDVANRTNTRRLYTGAATGAKVVGAHALGESFEEVSEELLADFSKSVFNVVRWMQGKDSLNMGQWDNKLDRYGMAALGGLFGGGINSAATDFVQSKNLANMNRTQALQELIYMVNNGEEADFLKSVDKMKVGDKNLSANQLVLSERGEDGQSNTVYAEAQNILDSQDYVAKKQIYNTVYMIKNILESEGAKLDKESLINTLTLENKDKVMKELRLSNLRNATSLSLYLQEFQTLQQDLYNTNVKIRQLMNSQPDLKSEQDPTILAQIQLLNQQLLNLRAKKDAFLDGRASAQFVADALFEINPLLHNFAIKLTEALFLEDIYGKPISEISDSEKEEGIKQYEAYAKTSMKNDIHRQRVSFQDMITNATPVIQLQLQILKANEENNQQILNTNKLIGDILEQTSALTQVPGDIDSILARISKTLGALDGMLLKEASMPYLSEDTINTLNLIVDDINTPVEGESTVDADNRVKILKSKYATVLREAIAEQLFPTLEPIVNQSYLNPEIRKSLTDVLYSMANEYNQIAQYEDSIASIYGLTDPDDVYDKQLELFAKANEIKSYASQISSKPNVPILEFLSNFAKSSTNSDLDPMKHWEDTMKLFTDATKDGKLSADDLTVSDEWMENNDEMIKIMDAFRAVIYGARNDNADLDNPTGFTHTLNFINSKVGNTDWEPLAEIDKEEADLILQDIEVLKKRFELAANLSAINRGQKLKQLEKVAVRTNFLLYKNLSHLSDVVPDDWNKDGTLDKLKAVIEDAEFLKANHESDNLTFSKEEKIKAAKEMQAIEDAIYDFFNANKVDGKLDSEKLGHLIYKIAGMEGFFAKNGEILTEKSTSIDKNAFIWWLASRAAIKATDFYGAYSKSLSDDRAPIFSQELATYLGTAAIFNMDVLNAFAKAYGDTFVKEFRALPESDRKKYLNESADDDTGFATALLDYFNGHDQVPQYMNMIFIEGAPGTGKSKGSFKNIAEIIKKVKEDLLENAIVAHVTKKSAQETADDLETTGKVFDKYELLKWISDEYTPAQVKKVKVYDAKAKGLVEKERPTLAKNSYAWENGRLVNKLKLNKYNNDELPKVMFIDEISHYNEQELSMIQQFAQENGIVVITAGDLNQNVQKAWAELTDGGEALEVSISRNKFIHSPKLGVSLRSRNKSIEDTMASMENAITKIDKGEAIDITTYYIEDTDKNPGLYGAKVFNSTSVNDIEGIKTEELFKTIDLMFKTLKDGEKIGYIGQDKDTKLRKYLKEKYEGKYEVYEGFDALGREGQYYIVENPRDVDSSTYAHSLYTGISRAEQGVLVIAPNGSMNDGLVKSVSHTESKELQILNLGLPAIKRSKDVREEQLQRMLEDVEPNELIYNEPTKSGPAPVVTVAPTVGLPPVIGAPPITPRIVSSAWTNKLLLENEITRLKDTFSADTKVRDNYTGDIYEVVDVSYDEEEKSGTTYYMPKVTLKKDDGETIEIPLEDFKTNYEFFTEESVTPIYNVGDKIVLEDGAGTNNVEITSLDTTDPKNPVYTLRNINNSKSETMSQADLQKKYKGFYNPTVIPAKSVQPDTGLENLQGTEYEGMLTFSNWEEHELPVDPKGHINHLLYTFDTFIPGMDNKDGKAVFDGSEEEFEARIDNMIGLAKLLGTPGKIFDDYAVLEKKLGAVKNIIGNNPKKSVIVAELMRELGLTGTDYSIDFGFKSQSESDTNNPKYMRYNHGKARASYIYSEDPNADVPLRKNLVAVLRHNGENILEIPLGNLNSPLTLILDKNDEGDYVYADLWQEFQQYKEANKNKKGYSDSENLAHLAAIPEFLRKYPDLMDLIKFWRFTSNEMFYLDDDFTLALNPSNGPELSKRKGEKQLNGRYEQLQTFINVEEFAKHPQRYVSSIMMATDDTTADGSKIPGLNIGHSFILVSNNPKYVTDLEMVNRYLELINEPYKDVKLFYILPPEATIGDYLRNVHNIYTNQLPAGHKNRTSNKLYDIGNDFTAFRILEAIFDNGKFDDFDSLLSGIKEDIKGAIVDLKEIERKWNKETLTLDPSNIIEGVAEDKLFQLLLDNGLTEKEARRHMAIREQRQYMNRENPWGKPSLAAGKTIAQGFTYYLTGIVWEQDPLNKEFITSAEEVNRTIKALENAAKGKMDKVYFKSQWSDEKVAGNFVKVRVDEHNKYTLGRTPSGAIAYYKVNGKIDTPVYWLNDISKAIHKIVQGIYYDPKDKVWRSTNSGNERYLGKSKGKEKTTKEIVIDKYKKYADKLNDFKVLEGMDTATEHEMLVALANDYNKTPNQYAFVIGDKLYLTTNTKVKLNNPTAEVATSSNQLTFENAVYLPDNKIVDVALGFTVDPTSLMVTEVTAIPTRYFHISKTEGSTLNLSELDYANIKDMMALMPDPIKKKYKQWNFDSYEKFRASIIAYQTGKTERDISDEILKFQDNLKDSRMKKLLKEKYDVDLFNRATDSLESIKTMATTLVLVDLKPDDYICTPDKTRTFRVLSVNGEQVGVVEIVNNEETESSTINPENFYKVENPCNGKIVWNLI